MQNTAEQDKIIQYSGDLLVVKAGAGCAKTSTLERIAQNRASERMLYLVFGKANQKEAEKKFAGTRVASRTQHAIALSRCGLNIQHKLTENYRLTDIKNFLKIKDWALAQYISDLFNEFLISDIESISKIPGASSKDKALLTSIWDAARDGGTPFPCKPDVYLKHYCLQPPELHTWFSTILLDEAQDTNPVVSDWIMRQKTKKIIVGDDHQQLFRFRGAGNFLESAVKKYQADTLTLTQSFRYGQPIAAIANLILSLKARLMQSEALILKGNPKVMSEIYSSRVSANTEKEVETVLHRTVAGTLQTALDNPKKKLYWIGGMARYRMQEVLDVFYFSNGQSEKISRKKLLTEYKSFKEYRHIAEVSQDVEQKRILKLVDTHGRSLEEKLLALSGRSVKEASLGELAIGTVHAAKGLEFDIVRLAEDFRSLADLIEQDDKGVLSDELNILYVAVTRAIKKLTLNNELMSLCLKDPKIAAQIKMAATSTNNTHLNSASRPTQSPPKIVRREGEGRTFTPATLRD